MERLAELVLRHRRLVVLAWAVVLLAGAVAAGRVADRLTFDFSLPGQPGYETEVDVAERYGTSTFDTYVPVLTVPAGTTVAEQRDEVAAVFEAVRSQVPGVRVSDLASTGDEAFVGDDGRTTYALVQGPLPTGFEPGVVLQLQPVLEQAAAQAGFEVGLTSYGLLSAGGETEGPSVLVETLIGATGALAVLVFVFASFLALVPMVIAAVSILATFLLVLGLTYLTDVSFVVQFLVSLIGLGVAIDYSLLVVSRWREERAHGHDNAAAVVIAVRTAGHAVLASGVTVAISLVALLVVPVPFLRSWAWAACSSRSSASPSCSRCYQRSSAASARASTGPGSATRARPLAAGRPGLASSSAAGSSPRLSRSSRSARWCCRSSTCASGSPTSRRCPAADRPTTRSTTCARLGSRRAC